MPASACHAVADPVTGSDVTGVPPRETGPPLATKLGVNRVVVVVGRTVVVVVGRTVVVVAAGAGPPPTVVVVDELVVVGPTSVVVGPTAVVVVEELVEELLVVELLVVELLVVELLVVELLVDELLVDDVDEVLDVVLAVVVVGVSTHDGIVMTFVSSVTAPARASSRPCTFAFVLAVIDARARIVPAKLEPTPRVAELPTCQKTLQGCVPSSATRLLTAVMSVEPAWKMKTAFGSAWESSVSVPVIANDDGVL
jgi:hypothetical protein